jgi:hypothetical protein
MGKEFLHEFHKLARMKKRARNFFTEANEENEVQIRKTGTQEIPSFLLS